MERKYQFELTRDEVNTLIQSAIWGLCYIDDQPGVAEIEEKIMGMMLRLRKTIGQEGA